MTANKITYLAIVKGAVQGVGFRFHVYTIAQGLSIYGSVKNVSDGSVEIISQGQEDQLTEFFKQIQIGCGHVSKIDIRPYHLHKSFSTFKIEY